MCSNVGRMARRLRHALGMLGDGAFAGLVVGLAYGVWAVRLNHDLAHRMFVLAFRRIADSALVGGAGGMVVSALVAAFLAACARRGSRAARRGSVFLAVAVIGAVFGALFPLRELVFPLHDFSSRIMTATTTAALFISLAALVAARIADTAASRFRAVGRPLAAAVLMTLLAG